MDYLGIDIGGTQTKWAVIAPDNSVTMRGSVPTDFRTTEDEMGRLDGIVRPLEGRIGGIGISAPGTVLGSVEDGVIRGGGYLTFNDGFALGKALRERYQLPILVENDGKACALGEYVSGALRGCDLGVVVVIGTGIGGGIVVNGEVLRGAHGSAGEFSYINSGRGSAIQFGDFFGAQGSWLSLKKLVLESMGLIDDNGAALDKALGLEAVDGKRVFEWINAGEEGALAGLDRYASALCLRIFSLQAVLDPDVFAIGGGISAQPALISALQNKMAQLVDQIPFMQIQAPRIVRAENGNDSNLLGAVYECRRYEVGRSQVD